jgi:predicted porin
LYSFGRTAGDGGGACPGEAPGDSSNCRQWSGHISYDNPAGWGVGAWIDEANNPAGDAVFEYRALNGYFTVAKVKLSANFLDVGSDVAAERKLWSIHASYPVTPQITVMGGYYDYDVENTDDDSSMINFRVDYAFSKRTAAYLTAARINNDCAATRSASIGVIGATPTGAGEGQTAVMIGLRHSF